VSEVRRQHDDRRQFEMGLARSNRAVWHYALRPAWSKTVSMAMTESGEETTMSGGPSHRRVSAIFFLLLVIAGLAIAFVAFVVFVALPDVAHAIGG
jgi:hypothetical protein